jgi:hypothetical protein
MRLTDVYSGVSRLRVREIQNDVVAACLTYAKVVKSHDGKSKAKKECGRERLSVQCPFIRVSIFVIFVVIVSSMKEGCPFKAISTSDH